MKRTGIMEQSFSIALETSGRVGSVAVGAGQKLSDERTFSAPLRHSAELFDTIIELLLSQNKKSNQIDNICISVGPGSFTGVRISVTVAKMLALAAQSSVVAVNTTDAMALNVEDESIKRVATVIDAKRGQFFMAVFQRANDSWQKILPDCMMTPQEFKEKFDFADKPIYLLGEGLLYYAEKFKTENIRILDKQYWSPRAGNVFRLGAQLAQQGNFTDPLTLAPLYLRKPEAEENWEKKQASLTSL